jgi:norsolorinic acid ketoreductase
LTKAYLEKGWKVIAAVRDPKKMPDLKEGEVVVVKLDVGEKEDAKKVRHIDAPCRCAYRTLIAQAVEELKSQGITSVDVVIANAAINLDCGTNFKDIDVDRQEEVFRINVCIFPTFILSVG